MTFLSALGLGLRLGFGGGRQAIARSLLSGAAIALAVWLSLSAAGLFSAEAERERRTNLRVVVVLGKGKAVPDDRLLFAYPGGDRFGDRRIKRTLVAAVGDPRIPPWFSRLPAPGEMVVSPAFAEVLRSSEGRLIRHRYPERIVQVLETAWLTEPDELVAYLGAEQANMSGATVVVGFAHDPGGVGPRPPTVTSVGTPIQPIGNSLVSLHPSLADRLEDPFFQAVIFATIGLLGPIVVFIAVAARLSVAAREARFAAIRLVGGTPKQVRVAAAGESLAAAILGCAAGLILFFLSRSSLAALAPDGAGWFPTDIAPPLAVMGLVLVGVPIFAIVVTLVSLRRVVITPLGVIRHAGRAVRARWRVVVLVTGLVACALMMIAGGWVFNGRRGPIPIVIASTAFGLTAAGTAAVAPLVGTSLADALRRTTHGIGSLLGFHRLRADPRSAGRIVASLVVVVFAVGVAEAFTSAYAAQQGDRVPVSLRASVLRIHAPGTNDLPSRVAAVPGVSDVLPVWVAEVSGPRYENRALVFDCGDLERIVDSRSPPCHGGSVYVPENASTRPSDRGLTIRFSQGVRFQITTTRVVPTPIGFGAQEGLHVPLSAFPLGALEDLPPTYVLAATTKGGTGEELIRNALAGSARPVEIVSADEIRRRISPVTEIYVPQIRAGVELGTLLILAIAIATVLVATIDGIGERRRSMAMLAAAGTPVATLRRAVMVEIVMPLLGGVGLAAASSILVTRMFFATASAPFADSAAPIPVKPLVRICLFTLAGAMLAATAAFPSLSRSIRPDTLRSE
jgi:hypothetical protein